MLQQKGEKLAEAAPNPSAALVVKWYVPDCIYRNARGEEWGLQDRCHSLFSPPKQK